MVEKPRVNLLKRHHTPRATKRSPALFFGRRLFITLAVLASIGIIFSYQVSSTSESSGNFPTISLFSTIRHLVSSGDKALDGEEEDRVNFLLLGIGGEGHDGPQLTDTIIFTSFKPSDGSVAMMSLPRDMTVPIPNYGYRKVNHANAYGEMDDPGSGPELASQVIGEVLDEDIHYYLRVDFDGFAEFVDAIGGVDVYIENGFTDPNYPSHGKEYATCGYEEEGVEGTEGQEGLTDAEEENELAEILAIGQEEQGILEEALEEENQPEVIDYSCRFESITFYEGWTHMDGQTALKFARSRHGNNGEGSDFARSERQQKIILAVKDKVLSASTFLNPSRISKMMDTLKDNIATNLDVWEIVRLAGEFKDLSAGEIVPRASFQGEALLFPGKPLFVKVEIQNGTNITGLAFRASQLLDGQGFDVVKVGNAISRGYEHTVIYDLTNGQRSEELKALRDYLQADVTLSATGWMLSGDVVPQEITFSSDDYERLTTQDDIDFLIILGETAGSFAIGASPQGAEEIP
ncbi:MAG: putative transcription regulator [Candidatus Uhrbacteria bacterium GW2011_GWA2_52_8d]|uniref:Putative transcription regulator n=1 Tax=Candidatus Uhrbacteria bacterium GW2011_GWA2_52_8d TaxID=1618979 RepID=A0A0G1XNT8_9BACT|nr:MAG: putative transcription regulator [Candidatus Uhrbacteria bacterium GW2011_GWA2_52_8d]